MDEGGRFSTFIRASVSEAVVFPGGFFLVVSLEVGVSFAVSEESPGERLSGIGVGKDSSVEAGGIRIDCSSKGTSVLVGNELDLAKKNHLPRTWPFSQYFFADRLKFSCI